MNNLCVNGHDVSVLGRTTNGRCRECKRISERQVALKREFNSSLPIVKNGFKILTFDIENRPLSYWIPDRPTAEITAIAWSFGSPRSIECVLLGRETPVEMLTRFLEVYDKADMVTGHYIRRHDLPIINGALMEAGLPTLGPKLTQDTKMDMIKKSDIPASQEHLSSMLGIQAGKIHMSQHDWRDANRLTVSGMELTEKRVVADVVQHMQLRRAMIDAELLGSPKVWRP